MPSPCSLLPTQKKKNQTRDSVNLSVSSGEQWGGGKKKIGPKTIKPPAFRGPLPSAWIAGADGN